MRILSPTTINVITNIIGFLLAILIPVKTYLTSQPFDWMTFGLCIGGAVIAYFTGKGGIANEKALKQLRMEKGIITSADLKGTIFGSTTDFFIGTFMLLRTDKGKVVYEELKQVAMESIDLIKSPEGQKWFELLKKTFGEKPIVN
jgi:hypothetical protein